MKSRCLGKSEIEAPVVGFGAWAIGGWMWGGASEAESIRAIHASIDAGASLVDTAPIYGFGLSEEIVGKAIKDRRGKVVLASKCGLIWHAEAGDYFFTSDEKKANNDGEIKIYKCLSPKMIRWEVEQSLKRLGVDCIDLLQAHWQESTTPIAETMQTLMDLKAEGKIRSIGCSNATPAQMDEYRGAGQLDVDQELFSMLDRKHETANLPYCAKHDIAFLAYSPLAQGLLTGKIGPDRTFKDGDQRTGHPRFSVENRAKVRALLDRIQPIADGHGVSLSQIVIAWTAAQPGCTHVLAGARTAQQAIDNAKAGDIGLTDAELAAMKKAIEELAPGIR
jgi:methylglyoxal reductase